MRMSSERNFRPLFLVALLGMAGIAVTLLVLSTSRVQAQPQMSKLDRRAAKGWRFQRGGWTYVHLEGAPTEIGYQHGYLLAPEIEDAFRAVKLQDTHNTKRDWEFFRTTAREVLWPHIESEYQQELQGIAERLKARGIAMDLYDVVALNAFEEVPDYYVPWLEEKSSTSCRRRAIA
jgi:hypothetical protein